MQVGQCIFLKVIFFVQGLHGRFSSEPSYFLKLIPTVNTRRDPLPIVGVDEVDMQNLPYLRDATKHKGTWHCSPLQLCINIVESAQAFEGDESCPEKLLLSSLNAHHQDSFSHYYHCCSYFTWSIVLLTIL